MGITSELPKSRGTFLRTPIRWMIAFGNSCVPVHSRLNGNYHGGLCEDGFVFDRIMGISKTCAADSLGYEWNAGMMAEDQRDGCSLAALKDGSDQCKLVFGKVKAWG